jgi:membrane protein implicated in regulation of membrane protease activity
MVKTVSFLKVAWGWLKSFGWLLLLVLVGAFLFYEYVGKKRRSKRADVSGEIGVSITEEVAEKFKDSVADVRIETAVIKARTQDRRDELEDVRQVKDGKERRSKLAAILRKSI